MALPKTFSNDNEYFENCIHFFKKYEKLYNFPNTDVLVLKVFDEIPLEISESAGDLDDFLKTIEGKDVMPEFFEALKILQYDFGDYIQDDSVKKKYYPTMSEKKIHEVNYLAKEVDSVCKSLNGYDCHTVIDFGSGLGYVDEILFTEYNYKVLGIECSEDHLERAEIRRKKCFEHSKNHVIFVNHRIDENSHDYLKKCFEENFEGMQSFCITGLHACADLGANALKVFLKTSAVNSMVLMPCCYHKMAVQNDIFDNFPMSKSLLDVFKRYEGCKFMKIPFLRLAAHPPNRTECMKDSVFNLLSRAVLQLYAHRHKLTLKRTKRKAVKTRVTKEFHSYMEEAKKGYKIIESQSNADLAEKSHYFDMEEIHTIWRETFDSLTFKKAAIFIKIQNSLQQTIENLIVYDRVVFLKENGVRNCYVKQIFDQKLSPRCLALIAKREKSPKVQSDRDHGLGS